MARRVGSARAAKEAFRLKLSDITSSLYKLSIIVKRRLMSAGR
jgi:hypothetical protein